VYSKEASSVGADEVAANSSSLWVWHLPFDPRPIPIQWVFFFLFFVLVQYLEALEQQSDQIARLLNYCFYYLNPMASLTFAC
jgi:hypothetical protein